MLGLNTFQSTAISDQPLSANASVCRSVKGGTLASELLWQYTAAALAHMADVTGMPIAVVIEEPILAVLRHTSLLSYCDLE